MFLHSSFKIYVLFLLLLVCNFSFQDAADSCEYKVFDDYEIGSYIPENFRRLENDALDVDECGQECCNDEKCTAAVFSGEDCMLVNCEAMSGCDFVKTGEMLETSLILVNRTSSSGNHELENFLKKISHEKATSLQSLSDSDESTPVGTTSNSENSNYPVAVPDTGQNIAKPPPLPEAPKPAADLKSPTTSYVGQLTSLLPAKANGIGSSQTDANPDDALTPQPPKPPSVSPITTPTVTTTMPPTGIKKLVVSAGGNQQIRLPKDSVVVHAEVSPKSESSYDYEWKLIKHPDDFQGTQTGIQTDTLKLTTLTIGHYEFKVEVKGENALSEDYVNITVLPKIRVNTPPVAIISPSFQELTLPTDATVLDGSQSHDDDGIDKYEWEEVQGPLQANINKDESGNLPNTKVLQLKGLSVGNYTFRLTVTDTDKVMDSTLATILVKNKIDNPPIANAGSNQVIHLPQNSAILCGNDSTDDWGIVSYKWSLSVDSKNEVADMQGARTQCLVLSNLEVGDYTFQLTVTDEAGQEDTAKVTIIVQPKSNHPPVANAGKDQQLLLPLDNGVVIANLDGSKSSDDKAITSVLWAMTAGPEAVTIIKNNLLQTTATGITAAGKYTFTLKVTDEDGASSSDSVVVTVKDEQPPVANAGPDLVLKLPDNVAWLDGSQSTDDYGISEYEWTRSDKSPAAGFALNQSNHQAILHVAGLVQGSYVFILKVTNIRGKSSTDEAKLTIFPDPLVDNLVELHLAADILTFDEVQKQTVVKQLEVLLSLQNDDEVVVQSIYSDHGTGHMVVLFYVKTEVKNILPAMQVSDTLNSKLKSDVAFLDFKFLRADTYVCKNLCSGHGRCHSGSKECECDMFWMENFSRVLIGDGKRNCDWSVLYVGIACFTILAVLSCATWFLACCCLKRRLKSPHKRRKNYITKSRYEKLPMKPHRNGHIRKNGYVRSSSALKSSSIMRSLSSSSSSLSGTEDGKEHTLFERKRLLLNGNGRARYNNAYQTSETNNIDVIKRKSSFSSSGSKENIISPSVDFSRPGNDTGHQRAFLRAGGDGEDDEIL